MVSFTTSTNGMSTAAFAQQIPFQQQQDQRRRRHASSPDLQFTLTEHSGKQLLARFGSTRSKGFFRLPLASLTTAGQQQLQQQPFQQEIQPLTCKQTVTKGSSSNNTQQEAQQGRKTGWISIGLLQQSSAQQDTSAHEAARQHQQHQCTCRNHKRRHKQQQHQHHHHDCQQHQQQHQQRYGTLSLETAAGQATQQPSQQQQRECQEQDASSSPVASLLGCVTRAKLLVAGAASAIVSRTAMAPLERVKMDLLLKTSNRSAVDTAVWVWKHEGLAGFWKGNGINLLRTAPFKALNFASFDFYSRALSGIMPDGSNSGRFLAGAMAGITATLICFPLDVLRTRLMAPWGHKYGGPLTTLKCMVQYEGLGALYAGVVPAVIGMAPSGAVFYGVYDLLKARHLKALSSSSSSSSSLALQCDQQQQQQQQQHELPVLYTLLYGALAGAAAETFLYPLEVIRRKMQLQSMAAGAAVLASPGSAAAAAAAATPNMLRLHGLKAASGALVPSGAGVGMFGAAGVPGAAAVARITAACSAIVRADGFAGFYAGLLPNMLQVLPSAALSYGTYESVKQMLGTP